MFVGGYAFGNRSIWPRVEQSIGTRPAAWECLAWSPASENELLEANPREANSIDILLLTRRFGGTFAKKEEEEKHKAQT